MTQRPGRGPTRRTTVVLTGIGGVLGGILVFAIVANVFGTTADQTGSAATTFDVGSAENRAASIADGGPLLFQDPLGRARDIYVQHLGGDDWLAFEAHSPGAPRDCFLEWDAADMVFRDACDGQIFPADGAGLAMYPVTIDDRGHVIVDLRQQRASPTTTLAPSTTSRAVPRPS